MRYLVIYIFYASWIYVTIMNIFISMNKAFNFITVFFVISNDIHIVLQKIN